MIESSFPPANTIQIDAWKCTKNIIANNEPYCRKYEQYIEPGFCEDCDYYNPRIWQDTVNKMRKHGIL